MTPLKRNCAQETWAKKERRWDTSHFRGKFLRQIKSQESIEESLSETLVFPEDDDDLVICSHCGKGIPNKNTTWILCDKQKLHQFGYPQSVSQLEFVCVICSFEGHIRV